MLIGILALQGNIREHRDNMERHGVECRLIKTPVDLDGIDGLIIPGGESTALRKLIATSGLERPVLGLIRESLPVWGTCAGVILLASGGIWPCVDIQVDRNAYGSQLSSRVVNGMSAISNRASPMVFIRSPRISFVAEYVQILAVHEGDVVAARQQDALLTTFHPELVENSPFTGYFISMVRMAIHGKKTVS